MFSRLLTLSLLIASLPLPGAAAELIIAPPNGEADAVPLLRDAIEKCRAEGIHRLVLGRGTWNLYPDKAEGMFRHISNHDDGYRRVALHLDGFKDFEVDGSGATLLSHGIIIPIAIDRSTNVTLRNLILDCAKPFQLEGTVTAVGEDWFEVRTLPGCDAEIRQGKLFGGITEASLVEGNSRPEASQDIRWNYWIDPTNKCAAAVQPRLSLWNEKLQRNAEATKVGDNLFRIRNAHNILPAVGSVMVCKGMHNLNRLAPAMHLSSVDGVLVENITIHRSGGMGIIVEDCSNVTLRACQVALKPGRASLVTTTADATHFVGCRGKITVEGCLFENMLDDACNVHGVYAIAEELLAPDKLAISFSHFQQLGTAFARPGDRLRLLQRDTLLGYAECTVRSVARPNADYYILTLDQPLAGKLRPNSSVENLSSHPDFVFRKNTVRNNRARSLLCTTPGAVLIEDNDFVRSSMMCLLVEGDNHFWYESGAVQDVTFRGNRITGLSPRVELFRLSPLQQGNKGDLPPYHRNIRILDNTIIAAGDKIINADRIAGLEFSRNTVTLAEAPEKPEAAVNLTRCEEVVMRKNKFNRTAPVNNQSKDKSVLMDDNQNLSIP